MVYPYNDEYPEIFKRMDIWPGGRVPRGRVRQVGGWTEQFSANRSRYFYNRITDTKQFAKPEEWKIVERILLDYPDPIPEYTGPERIDQVGRPPHGKTGRFFPRSAAPAFAANVANFTSQFNRNQALNDRIRLNHANQMAMQAQQKAHHQPNQQQQAAQHAAQQAVAQHAAFAAAQAQVQAAAAHQAATARAAAEHQARMREEAVMEAVKRQASIEAENVTAAERAAQAQAAYDTQVAQAAAERAAKGHPVDDAPGPSTSGNQEDAMDVENDVYPGVVGYQEEVGGADDEDDAKSDEVEMGDSQSERSRSRSMSRSRRDSRDSEQANASSPEGMDVSENGSPRAQPLMEESLEDKDPAEIAASVEPLEPIVAVIKPLIPTEGIDRMKSTEFGVDIAETTETTEGAEATETGEQTEEKEIKEEEKQLTPEEIEYEKGFEYRKYLSKDPDCLKKMYMMCYGIEPPKKNAAGFSEFDERIIADMEYEYKRTDLETELYKNRAMARVAEFQVAILRRRTEALRADQAEIEEKRLYFQANFDTEMTRVLEEFKEDPTTPKQKLNLRPDRFKRKRSLLQDPYFTKKRAWRRKEGDVSEEDEDDEKDIKEEPRDIDMKEEYEEDEERIIHDEVDYGEIRSPEVFSRTASPNSSERAYDSEKEERGSSRSHSQERDMDNNAWDFPHSRSMTPVNFSGSPGPDVIPADPIHSTSESGSESSRNRPTSPINPYLFGTRIPRSHKPSQSRSPTMNSPRKLSESQSPQRSSQDQPHSESPQPLAASSPRASGSPKLSPPPRPTHGQSENASVRPSPPPRTPQSAGSGRGVPRRSPASRTTPYSRPPQAARPQPSGSSLSHSSPTLPNPPPHSSRTTTVPTRSISPGSMLLVPPPPIPPHIPTESWHPVRSPKMDDDYSDLMPTKPPTPPTFDDL